MKKVDEYDDEIKAILADHRKQYRRKAIGLALNSLALGLIVIGFIYNASMPYLLVEAHGAITGIFTLGTVLYIRDHVLPGKRNT